MRLLSLYISRTIFSGILISLLLFAGLFFFISFIKELKYVGTADYDIVVALLYVALSLPQQLYELAPSVILVGSLIALGSMAAASEITVMRAAGMSSMKLTGMVMQAGIVVALAVALLGEYVVPDASSVAQTMRVKALNQQIISGGDHGTWSRDGSRYINIGAIHPDQVLHQVTIYEIGADSTLQSTTTADYASPHDQGWLLSGVSISRISDEGVDSEVIDELKLDRLIEPGLFDVLKSEPEDMSARALHRYSEYLDANELDADRYRLQFWIKLFTPLTCLVMILIALPMVINTTARSGGIGQRVVLGLGIGILFFVFNRMVNYIGLNYGIHPAVSAALPPLIVAVIMATLLRRA